MQIKNGQLSHCHPSEILLRTRLRHWTQSFQRLIVGYNAYYRASESIREPFVHFGHPDEICEPQIILSKWVNTDKRLRHSPGPDVVRKASIANGT